MNMYGLRINRSQSEYLQSNTHIKAFKHLSELIYGEERDILFAYGEIFTFDVDERTYADLANEYTGFSIDQNGIESIDIIKINDLNQVGIHPAYDWSDLLFYFVSAESTNDEYSRDMILSASCCLESKIREPITKENLDKYWLAYDAAINQIVFRRDLVGVEIVDSIDNTEDISVFDEVNRLAEKYKLFHKIKSDESE